MRLLTLASLGTVGPALYVAVVAVSLHAGSRVASVQGRITFRGSPPPATPIDMSYHPYCASAHRGAIVVTQSVLVAANGGLSNVLVYAKEGVQGDFPAAEGEVLLDQENCIYHPRVLGVRTGQALAIRNSDGTLHNVHAFAKQNRSFNIGQPLKGLTSRRVFGVAELAIDVRCDVHDWMQSYVGVFEHPFFAVTDENGSFSLPDLPPGDYVIEAWHETLGTRTQSVTVTAGGATEITFEFGE